MCYMIWHNKLTCKLSFLRTLQHRFSSCSYHYSPGILSTLKMDYQQKHQRSFTNSYKYPLFYSLEITWAVVQEVDLFDINITETVSVTNYVLHCLI